MFPCQKYKFSLELDNFVHLEIKLSWNFWLWLCRYDLLTWDCWKKKSSTRFSFRTRFFAAHKNGGHWPAKFEPCKIDLKKYNHSISGSLLSKIWRNHYWENFTTRLAKKFNSESWKWDWKKKRILFLLCNNLKTHLNRKILFEQVRRHVFGGGVEKVRWKLFYYHSRLFVWKIRFDQPFLLLGTTSLSEFSLCPIWPISLLFLFLLTELFALLF